jgi:uncharacterized membrane protein YbhN (UPF0104 family)
MLALAVVVGSVLVYQVTRDWQTFSRTAGRWFPPAPLPLLGAWAVQTVGWLLVVSTWARILGRMGGVAPFRRHLQIYTLSSLANVVPGSVWLPATRVTAYRQHGVHPVAVGAALAVEWLLLGVAGILLYGLAAPFSHMPPAVSLLALVVAGALAATVLHPRVFAWFMDRAAGRFGYDGQVQRLAGRDIVTWFVCEFVVLVLAGLGLYLVMTALSPVASLPDAMGVTGLTLALANLLAWLPASALIKDASMVVLLTPLYGSAGLALVVVVAWRLWLAVVQLSWAGVAIWIGRHGGADVGLAEEEAWTS